jgi:hypothetical protein
VGTSKRRLNEKIKNLLKDQPLSELNNHAPEVTGEILTTKNLEKNLNESLLTNSFEIISKAFRVAGVSGFKGKYLKDLKEDEVTREEFFESIIDEIEKETIIDSKILKKAFKLTMVKFIDEEFDTTIFAQMLFYKVIYLILEQELFDTLKDMYEYLTSKQIDSIVTTATDKIFTDAINHEIEKFIKKDISLSYVFEKITEQTSNVTFGEF